MQTFRLALSARAQLLIPFSLLWLIMLGGCSSQPTLTQISAFGTATKSLADNAQKGYALVDEKVVQVNLYQLANDPTRGPKDADFEGIVGAQTTSKELANALETRIKALSRLGAYAEGLKLLATADFQEDIDAAALELNGALTGLVDSHKELSGNSTPILSKQSIGIIASAVEAIGGAIVEKKRKDAIRTVIVESDTAVQSVAKLIGKELNEKGGAGDRAVQAVLTTEGVLKTQYNRYRTNPQSTFDKRLEKLERIKQLHKEARITREFFSAVEKAANQVGTTHGVLLSEVQKDKFTSAEIAASVGELVNRAGAVYTFYKSLQE